jgi:hypothetical protein
LSSTLCVDEPGYKPNFKIYQAAGETIIVRMDIAKWKHDACFVDVRERVLKKSFSMFHSKQGGVATQAHHRGDEQV